MTDKELSYATGDINSTAKGTGARANQGKIALSLVPFHLFGGVARVLMSGKLKYAGWNWARGMAWSVSFDCLLRHLFKWWFLGEERDPESGEHHLDHVLTNALFLRHYVLTYSDGDDRPPAHADFAAWIDDFNTPFDETAYLDRNPAVKELLEKRKREKVEQLKEAYSPSNSLGGHPDYRPKPRESFLKLGTLTIQYSDQGDLINKLEEALAEAKQ